jgi:Xaa-Pro aminopeptidase
MSLLPGEKDAPAGLKRALKNTNELQDVLTTTARPGLLPGDVYNPTMEAMQKRGIEAKIYSHPIGNQGHGLGPNIDYRSGKREDIGVSQAQPFRKGCYTSIELNTVTPVPEWGGQKLFVMMEDDAYLTDEATSFSCQGRRRSIWSNRILTLACALLDTPGLIRMAAAPTRYRFPTRCRRGY